LYPQWELLTEKMTSRFGNGSEREEREREEGEREEEGEAFGLLAEHVASEDADLNLSHDTLANEAGHAACQLLEVEGGIENVDLLQEYSSSSSVFIQSMELDLEGTLNEGLHGDLMVEEGVGGGGGGGGAGPPAGPPTYPLGDFEAQEHSPPGPYSLHNPAVSSDFHADNDLQLTHSYKEFVGIGAFDGPGISESIAYSHLHHQYHSPELHAVDAGDAMQF
jgi:hypothetical protein